MPTLTDKQIDELRELYERTTRGEWGCTAIRGHDGAFHKALVGSKEAGPIATLDSMRGKVGSPVTLGLYEKEAKADAEWIAAAHNAMPALLETLELHNTEYGACGHHPCHQYDLRPFTSLPDAAHGCVTCERDVALATLAEQKSRIKELEEQLNS